MKKRMVKLGVTASGALALVAGSVIATGGFAVMMAYRPLPWYVCLPLGLVVLVAAILVFGVLLGAIEGIEPEYIRPEPEPQDGKEPHP